MHGVVALLTGLIVPAAGAIAAAFTLPLAERWGWGLLPPRLIVGVREYPHTGSQGIGLYRRAWSWHLFAGLLLAAALPIYLPLVYFAGVVDVVFQAIEALWAQILSLLGLYGVVIWVGYALLTGRHDAATLGPIAGGIGSFILVLTAFASVTARASEWTGHAAAGPYFLLLVVTVGGSVSLARRAKGYHPR